MPDCGETFQDKTQNVVGHVVFGYSLRCFHDDLRLGEMGRAEIRIPAQQVNGKFIDNVRNGPNGFDGNVPNITTGRITVLLVFVSKLLYSNGISELLKEDLEAQSLSMS